MSLDFLKAEIATKRKLATDDNSKPSKYMRRGELEKLKEEQERQKKEASQTRTEGSSKLIAEPNVSFVFSLIVSCLAHKMFRFYDHRSLLCPKAPVVSRAVRRLPNQ